MEESNLMCGGVCACARGIVFVAGGKNLREMLDSVGAKCYNSGVIRR